MRALPDTLIPNQPPTALAPMQDVTTRPFMAIVNQFGPPDYFFTEYFRVHEHSRPETHILDSIINNPSDRPVFAQLIGEDIEHMQRTVRLLIEHPIAGIDLNMGCPAPKVYKKNVGGGLMRDPQKVDQLLGALREVCPGRFTVKMRIGFADMEHYETIIGLVNKHDVDLLSVHGRTVKGMYRSEVDYDAIKLAVDSANCPVLANGDVSSVEKGHWVLKHTGAHGLMIGRHAIRNPWIFRQLRESFASQSIFQPTLGDVREYVDLLWVETRKTRHDEGRHVAYMKKFLNFVGQSVDPEGAFLRTVRRARSPEDYFKICDEHLVEGGRDKLPFSPEPYPGLIARPSREGPTGPSASSVGEPEECSLDNAV
ncbi:tRNA dihydrouridine synthase [Cerasicoccus frondis]|uniref:tRNA dihydrouridine synthase n=1 Tax=Cerasicoccus frondis TaxID=490090 RepID=UPI002852A12E|nr:tRNA-dihydrouridine synthase family protein [Cerasicoccus frondis]